MICVVDASVAMKWFLEEDLKTHAMWLLDNEGSFHAPDLIVPEVANAAWRKHRMGEISAAHAREIVGKVSSGIPILHAPEHFGGLALDIAMELAHPAYNCFYIACARLLGDVLITTDKRLLEAISGSSHGVLVRDLASLPT
jgi:predicted nucleic acid-binding protein